MTTKLYDANHLYMMTIAHIRRNKKKHHPKKITSAKRTYQIKTAKLVSIFAARWRSICKYFSGQTTGKEARKSNSSKKNTTGTYTPKDSLKKI